jgi:hypothetical protein
VIASTQKTARKNLLEDFALTKQLTVLKQFAPKQFAAVWVLFIVMPLSNEVVLKRLRMVSAQPPRICRPFFAVSEKRFRQSRCGEQSITSCGW